MTDPDQNREGGDGRIGQAKRAPMMSLCVHCGQPPSDSCGFCTDRHSDRGDDWAEGNRIMCDFLHRGIVSPGPAESVARSIELLVDRLETAHTG